jgi:hypothetical protein
MRIVLIAVVAAVFSVVVQASGPTKRVTISGPGLGTPIEIVNPALLELSNVWEGRFIGATLAAPQVKGPVYVVTFEGQAGAQRGALRRIYIVRVARDARVGALLIYLPGPTEEGYALNASSVARPGQDGRWHRASAAWAAAIERYLP